jgi:transcription elongation factor Elf1
MGGKSKSAKPKVKPKRKLETTFNCPQCSHQKSVEIKLNRKGMVGILGCRVCGVDFQMRINSLNEAIDVYTEWLDTLEQSNRE